MIDIIFAIIIIIACIKGYQKGLIIAVFSIIAFIIGLAAALKLSAVVAGWLNGQANISAKWLPFISFALVFLLLYILSFSVFFYFMPKRVSSCNHLPYNPRKPITLYSPGGQ